MTGLTGFAVATDPQALLAVFLPVIMAFLVVFLIIMIGVYIYTSFALMRIAQKTGTEPAWLAWVPIGNLVLLSRIAKMDWWPVLLILGGLIPFVGFLPIIAFMVFVMIWAWKTFEAVGRPGWWVLLGLIPFAGGLVVLILLGVAAWGEPSSAATPAATAAAAPATSPRTPSPKTPR